MILLRNNALCIDTDFGLAQLYLIELLVLESLALVSLIKQFKLNKHTYHSLQKFIMIE